MPTFNYQFTVNAPQESIVAFHRDTRVLKTLSPPPIYAQIHSYEPLADGSVANFTLWFGPFPVRWQAVHSDVGDNGFTDTQVIGPLKKWQHRHGFSAINPGVTQVSEHIEYEFHSGLRGLPGRLLFSKPALMMLFTARKIITRRAIGKAGSKE